MKTIKILLTEFSRILKNDGFVSTIKHNKAGRIIQKAVFDYDIEAVKTLLNGGVNTSRNFGEIKTYEDTDLLVGNLVIDKCYSICALYVLQNNDIKYKYDWQQTMLDIETAVSKIDAFMSIAFFHYVILKKIS